MKPTQNTDETTKQKDDNNVHLEGVVNECVISGEKDGIVTANMKLHTIKFETYENGDMVKSDIYHRIKVRSKDTNLIKSIQDDCIENIQRRTKGTNPKEAKAVFVSINGYITSNESTGPYIEVQDDIRRTDNLNITNNNLASIKGNIKRITYTNNMVKMFVEVKAPNSTKTMIPVMISKKQYPDIWEDIAQQKLGKQLTLTSRGPIITEQYGDKKSPTHVIRMLGNNVKLTRELKETTKKTTGPTL